MPPLYQPLSGGTTVTVDADGTLVVDGTTVEMGTDAEVAAAIAALGGAAALDVGTTAGTVAAGDDGRFTDARTPLAHAASHGPAGSDPVVDHVALWMIGVR